MNSASDLLIYRFMSHTHKLILSQSKFTLFIVGFVPVVSSSELYGTPYEFDELALIF